MYDSRKIITIEKFADGSCESNSWNKDDDCSDDQRMKMQRRQKNRKTFAPNSYKKASAQRCEKERYYPVGNHHKKLEKTSHDKGK